LTTKAPIGRLRGTFHDFPPPAHAHRGIPAAKLMPTFHPAYLLRSPGEKGKAWEDLKHVMRYLNIPVP
jgi:DNA polymerase